jgi:hypothetical protein
VRSFRCGGSNGESCEAAEAATAEAAARLGAQHESVCAFFLVGGGETAPQQFTNRSLKTRHPSLISKIFNRGDFVRGQEHLDALGTVTWLV